MDENSSESKSMGEITEDIVGDPQTQDSQDSIAITNLITIENVRAFMDEVGTVHLHRDDIARGLGQIRYDYKGGKSYERIDWGRIKQWLVDFALINRESDIPEYIPEQYVYILAMKASNETAKAFQRKLAFEIIPQIRRTGGYIPVKPEMSDLEIVSRALIISQRTIRDKDAIIAQMKPKADFYSRLIESSQGILSVIIAKEFNLASYQLHNLLIDKGYLIDKGWKLDLSAPLRLQGLTTNGKYYSTVGERTRSLWTPAGRDWITDVLFNSGNNRPN